MDVNIGFLAVIMKVNGIESSLVFTAVMGGLSKSVRNCLDKNIALKIEFWFRGLRHFEIEIVGTPLLGIAWTICIHYTYICPFSIIPCPLMGMFRIRSNKLEGNADSFYGTEIVNLILAYSLWNQFSSKNHLETNKEP